jgi:hypothetical protein
VSLVISVLCVLVWQSLGGCGVLPDSALSAIIGAGTALVGVLLSQLLTTWREHSGRRLGLFFDAKREAYQNLMAKAGEYSLAPGNESRYLAFLSALESAKIVASDEVFTTLDGPTGVGVVAQRIRFPGPDQLAILTTDWYEALTKASLAMRADLKRLSAGMQ